MNVQVQPLFFGPSDAQLFGVYHPPEAALTSRAVLLCLPPGHEYMMSHWLFRRLASHLTKLGAHVLRFDFFGTGDSAGGSDQGNLTQWRKDLTAAGEELLALSGVKRLSVVTLRLSGAVAGTSDFEGLGVDHLVLWDPVVSGTDFLGEIEDFDQRLLTMRLRNEADRQNYRLGAPMPHAFRRALGDLDLRRAQRPAVAKVSCVLSEPAPCVEALQKVWGSEGDVEIVPLDEPALAGPPRWAPQRSTLQFSENALQRLGGLVAPK